MKRRRIHNERNQPTFGCFYFYIAMIKFPRYAVFARHIPAIISSLPATVLYFYFFKDNLGEVMKFVSEL
jgi:hypothetical protein